MRCWLSRALLCLWVVLTGRPCTAVLARPSDGQIIYFTTFQHGLSGWSGTTRKWQATANYIKTDLQGTSVILAPFAVHIRNYAVQSKFRVVSWRNQSFHDAFTGIVFRAHGVPQYSAPKPIGDRGLAAGPYRPLADVKTEVVVKQAYQLGGRYVQVPYAPGAGWYTYRVEVRGNHIRVLIDGKQVISLSSSDSARGGRVGLVVSNAAAEVKGFRVATL